MTPAPPRPSSRIALGRLVLALPLAYAAWYLLREGNATAHTIAWSCGADGCSTSDPKVFLFMGGIAAAVACFLMLIGVLRLIAFGVALALGPLAAIQGWRDAIAGGLPASEVATEFKVWGAVAGAGLLLAFAGLVYELRATATLESLIGRERVPAELVDYQEGAKPGIGSGTLVFRDKSGHRHRRRFPAVPQSWTRRALIAVYPPHDPTRARIALTWYRPFNAAAARAALAEGTFEDSGAPGPSVIGELERLAALRREGLLSEAEFEQAKRRHLGT